MITEDNKKIDNMYNIRSAIRLAYLNNDTKCYEANLISEITNKYNNIIKEITADYKLYIINISIDDKFIDSDMIKEDIVQIVISNINKFILDFINDKNIINYINNSNPYIDYYYLGNTIKFIL